MDIRKLIKRTEYAGRMKCIMQVFEQFGIDSIEKIENSPAIIGSGKICDESIHAIASALMTAYCQPLAESVSARAEEVEQTAVEEAEVQAYRPAKRNRSEGKGE